MLERLNRAAPGDVVLVHACCHNPTGADLSIEQWKRLTELLLERQLTPFLDLAYQGFGSNLEEDVGRNPAGGRQRPGGAGRRVVLEESRPVPGARRRPHHRQRTPNRGPMRCRVMCCRSRAASTRCRPDHGAAIAACIFADQALRQSLDRGACGACATASPTCARCWPRSCARSDRRTARSISWSASAACSPCSGVSGAAVEALRARHHIYMLGDSRMNLAGITPGNVAYVAEAIAAQR